MGGVRNLTVAMGVITNNPGAVLVINTVTDILAAVSGSVTCKVTTTTAAANLNQNGIVPWVVSNVSSNWGGFCAYTASGFDEYTGYTAGPLANNSTANYLVTGAGATESLAANAQINSLFIDATSGAYTLSDGVGTSLTIGTAGTAVTTNGAILVRGTNATIIGVSQLAFTGGAIVYTDTNQVLTINSPISGVAGLIKDLDGTLVLGADNSSSLTGTVWVNRGKLTVAADNQLGATNNPLLISSGTLKATGSFATGRPVSLLSAGSTFEVPAGVTLTLSGAIGGQAYGSLSKTGTGTLIVASAATYPGKTRVKGGMLQMDGTLGNAAIIIDTNATLNGAGTITWRVDGENSDLIDVNGTLAIGNLALAVTASGTQFQSEYVVADYATPGGQISGGAFRSVSLPPGWKLAYNGTISHANAIVMVSGVRNGTMIMLR